MIRPIPIAASLALLPAAALAHPGHAAGGGFLAGAGHPLGGNDHLLAMVALGLLAAQVGGRAVWALPAAFVGAMLLGGLAGAEGLPFPAVEPMILASIIVLSALIALAARPPLGMLLGLSAVFGAAHGWAHGAEGPASGFAGYAAGFAVITLALHLVGIALGKAMPPLSLRIFGGIAAVAGLALAVGA